MNFSNMHFGLVSYDKVSFITVWEPFFEEEVWAETEVTLVIPYTPVSIANGTD